MSVAERLVSLSDMRTGLFKVIRTLSDRPVLLLRHSKPVAALLDYDRYVELLDRIEDLEDRVAVYESREEGSDLKVPWEKVKADAGLLGH